MTTTKKTAAFGTLPIGTKCRLENCIGVKCEPIEDEKSRAFYASSGGDFWGWNFYYQFCGLGEWSHLSLPPEREVIVLD